MCVCKAGKGRRVATGKGNAREREGEGGAEGGREGTLLVLLVSHLLGSHYYMEHDGYRNKIHVALV